MASNFTSIQETLLQLEQEIEKEVQVEKQRLEHKEYKKQAEHFSRLEGRIKKLTSNITKNTSNIEDLQKKHNASEFELEIWKEMEHKLQEELKNKKAKLDQERCTVWKTRDQFCDQMDEFFYKHGILSKWWKQEIAELSNITTISREKVRKETKMKELRKEIEQIEAEVLNLQIQRQEVEKENGLVEEKIVDLQVLKEKLIKESDGEEIMKLKTSLNAVMEKNNILSSEIIERENTLKKGVNSQNLENSIFSQGNMRKIIQEPLISTENAVNLEQSEYFLPTTEKGNSGQKVYSNLFGFNKRKEYTVTESVSLGMNADIGQHDLVEKKKLKVEGSVGVFKFKTATRRK